MDKAGNPFVLIRADKDKNLWVKPAAPGNSGILDILEKLGASPDAWQAWDKSRFLTRKDGGISWTDAEIKAMLAKADEVPGPEFAALVSRIQRTKGRDLAALEKLLRFYGLWGHWNEGITGQVDMLASWATTLMRIEQ